MKTEFRRDVETKKIQAIAEIDTPSESGKAILFVLETIEKYGYDVERLISAFQLSGSSNPKQILEGLLFNLRKMGLVDISNNLSPIGKEKIRTQKIFLPERGKFEFCYFEDKLCPSTLLWFDRIEALKFEPDEEKIRQIASPFSPGAYKNIVNDTEFDFVRFYSSFQDGTITAKSSSSSKDMGTIIWKIDTDDEAANTLLFSTSRLQGKATELLVRPKVDAKKIIIDIVTNASPNFRWDEEMKAFSLEDLSKVSLDDLYNFQTILPLDKVDVDLLGTFSATAIREIAIFPRTETCAKEWIYTFIDREVKDTFLTKSDFNSIINVLREEPFFKKQIRTINSIHLSDCLDRYKQKSTYGLFWNLQSAMDLCLDEKAYGSPLINLNKDKYSMASLAKEIVGQSSPSKFVFFSKYISRPSQLKKCLLFSQSMALLGARDITIVSNQDIPISTKETNIKTAILEEWTHDRHFALYVDGDWLYYKMTGELDQCQYPANTTWTIDTVGQWEELTIIKVDKNAFPKHLNEFLESLEVK